VNWNRRFGRKSAIVVTIGEGTSYADGGFQPVAPRAAVTSRLETIPNERTGGRAWNYVAVGTGHPDGIAFWTRFVDAVPTAGYDGALSIENEDYTLGQRESVPGRERGAPVLPRITKVGSRIISLAADRP